METAETPFSLRLIRRCLMVWADSSAPSNALKDCSYHARVLEVTFLRYFRSWINSEAGGIFGAPGSLSC